MAPFPSHQPHPLFMIMTILLKLTVNPPVNPPTKDQP